MRAAVLSIPMVILLGCVGHAQPAPDSLPLVTLDCFQSYATSIALPEQAYRGISVDGDNFSKPTVRYRLQAASKTTLKIIEFPEIAERRKEYGKVTYEMTRDFTNSHTIVVWREDGVIGVKQLTVDFDNKLFSILQVPTATSSVPLVLLTVFKCR